MVLVQYIADYVVMNMTLFSITMTYPKQDRFQQDVLPLDSLYYCSGSFEFLWICFQDLGYMTQT